MSEFLDGKYSLIWFAGNPDVWAHLLEDVPGSFGECRCFAGVYELWAEEIHEQSGLTKLICIPVDTLGRDELGIFSCLAARSGVTAVAVSAWPNNPKLLIAKELGAFQAGDIKTVRELLKTQTIDSGTPIKPGHEQPGAKTESLSDSHPSEEIGAGETETPPIRGYPTLTEEELQALTR